MWGTVLVVALISACDPVRLSIALLLISRPRPMLSLLGYWLGGIAAGVAAAVGLLLVLRAVAPMLTQYAAAAAESPIVRHVQLFGGVTALSVAAVIAIGLVTRHPARVNVSGGGDLAVLQRQSTALAAVLRLSARGRNAFDGNVFWVAFAAGVISAIPPVEYLVVIAVILGSGAAAGAQVSAAMLFTVVSLAVIEIPLVSCLARPEKTHAAMLRMHDWVRVRRQLIVAVAVAVAGVLLVVTGMSA